MFKLLDSTAFSLCSCSCNYHSPFFLCHWTPVSQFVLAQAQPVEKVRRSKYLLQELPLSNFSVCCLVLPADKQKEWSQTHAAEYGAELITDWASAWRTDAHASNSDIDYNKSLSRNAFLGLIHQLVNSKWLIDQIRPCHIAFPDSKLSIFFYHMTLSL